MKKCRFKSNKDNIDGLDNLERQDGRDISHILVVMLEMDKNIPASVINIFFEEGVNFLVQDRFGFTALNFAIAFVDAI